MSSRSTPLVPLFSAKAAAFGVDLVRVAGEVIASERYVLGPQVEAFEAAFGAYVGVKHVVSVANGPDALELALRALGIGSGDRVVTVANAGFYASTAIRAIGASPVYVDVDDSRLTMSPDALEAALSSSVVQAVVVTHLYGQLADMATIAKLCASAGVPLVEDCAQAHGARSGGDQAGSWGATACFSFYPTKNLGALGDGGAVVTDDDQFAQRLRGLRQYGWGRKYEVILAGGRNSRLDELQAAVLAAKLPRLDAANAERRAIAKRYNKAFSGVPLKLPVSVGADYVAHLYVIRCEQRDALRAHLAHRGIASEIHYPVPDHHQQVVSDSPKVSLPVTEAVCRQALSLPCFPGLLDEQVDRVIGAVHEFHETSRCIG